MAKEKQPSYEDLQKRIEELESALAFEKEINRKMLGLSPDTPAENLPESVPWSTEWLQKQIDDTTITHGATTKVYKQRVIKLLRLQSGDIVLKTHFGKSALKDREYKPINETLTIETFFMLLAIMEFAVKEFDLDRKKIMDSLTEGEELEIKKVISNF